MSATKKSAADPLAQYAALRKELAQVREAVTAVRAEIAAWQQTGQPGVKEPGRVPYLAPDAAEAALAHARMNAVRGRATESDVKKAEQRREKDRATIAAFQERAKAADDALRAVHAEIDQLVVANRSTFEAEIARRAQAADEAFAELLADERLAKVYAAWDEVSAYHREISRRADGFTTRDLDLGTIPPCPLPQLTALRGASAQPR